MLRPYSGTNTIFQGVFGLLLPLESCRHQQVWLRGMDSNHDNQLQRLVSYQLDDPGVAHLSALSLACGATEAIARALRSFTSRPPRATPVCGNRPFLLNCYSIRERCPSGLRSTLGKRV